MPHFLWLFFPHPFKHKLESITTAAMSWFCIQRCFSALPSNERIPLMLCCVILRNFFKRVDISFHLEGIWPKVCLNMVRCWLRLEAVLIIKYLRGWCAFKTDSKSPFAQIIASLTKFLAQFLVKGIFVCMNTKLQKLLKDAKPHYGTTTAFTSTGTKISNYFIYNSPYKFVTCSKIKRNLITLPYSYPA